MSFYCGNEGIVMSKTPHQDYNGRDRCRGTTRCKRGNGKLRGIFLF